MAQKGITAHDLESSLVRLRTDIEGILHNTEEHVLTALYGFVNGASARMSSLEAEDLRLMRRVRSLEQRLDNVEKQIAPAE